MSIYPISTIKASARQAAEAFVAKDQEAFCPYPDWQDAATIWRDELDSEINRLHEEVTA